MTFVIRVTRECSPGVPLSALSSKLHENGVPPPPPPSYTSLPVPPVRVSPSELLPPVMRSFPDPPSSVQWSAQVRRSLPLPPLTVQIAVQLSLSLPLPPSSVPPSTKNWSLPESPESLDWSVSPAPVM